MENPFKWRHYESGIILLCVRWDESDIMRILVN
jgi:hypothetical protein